MAKLTRLGMQLLSVPMCSPGTTSTPTPSLMTPSGEGVPGASPVGSPNSSNSELESKEPLTQDVLISIIVSVTAIIIMVLLSFLILHIRKQRQLEPQSLKSSQGNELSSGIAASIVSVSAAPINLEENDPVHADIQDRSRKQQNPLGRGRSPFAHIQRPMSASCRLIRAVQRAMMIIFW